MKPPAFDYLRTETPAEILATLAEYGDDARILAGGLSLMPMLNMRLARPTVIIDTSRLAATAQIKVTTDKVVIPIGMTQARLLADPRLSTVLPLLAAALPWVGHAQTRARGTICGSVAHADPSGEIPLCVGVLEGEIELSTRRRKRLVKSGDFHIAMMMTDRRPDEMITRIILPVAKPNEGFAFREFGRRHGDFAIVACAAKVSGSAITFGVGGVADTPVVRRWTALDSKDFDDALNEFAWGLDARDDIHADARLRRDLVRKMGRQTIEEARQKCKS